jgi:hypothetical protein
VASRSSSRRRGLQHSYWDREREKQAEEGYGPVVHTIFLVGRGRGA